MNPESKKEIIEATLDTLNSQYGLSVLEDFEFAMTPETVRLIIKATIQEVENHYKTEDKF